MNYINKLYQLLDKKSKITLLWMVVFSIVISLVEIIGISTVMPFIDIATNFEQVTDNKYYHQIFTFFNFDTPLNFAIAFGIVLLAFYIFRAIINITYMYALNQYILSIYASTTQKLFAIYLNMPYKTFVNKNSSYLTKAIMTEAAHLVQIIQSALLILSEFFIVILLYILMLVVSWKVTMVFTLIFAIKLLFLTTVVSKRIELYGRLRAAAESKLYEIINKALGDFKHIKLKDSQTTNILKGQFNSAVDEYSKASQRNDTLIVIPRMVLETGGFGLVILLLVFLLYKNQTNVLYILPILSLFVLSLYRLLPSINRIISGYNILMYQYRAIEVVSEELQTEQEILAENNINFEQKISLEQVDFAYQKNHVLSNINLTINQGDSVAFIGHSGSGKSTLVDLITGLYRPKNGNIYIDGEALDERNLQNWRSKIGYIPQQVYLFDGTVAENICFGTKQDNKLLIKVLQQANIYDFLQEKEGLETKVGEGGIQLSGGQKQRIAIARALYSQPEILVLDEATSALDSDTEQKIMSEIYKISKDKTLIIIAHRLSTIQGCDKIYELKNGQIISQKNC